MWKKGNYELASGRWYACFEGEQINIGGNESYIAVCREHFKRAMEEKAYSDLHEEE